MKTLYVLMNYMLDNERTRIRSTAEWLKRRQREKRTKFLILKLLYFDPGLLCKNFEIWNYCYFTENDKDRNKNTKMSVRYNGGKASFVL